MAASPSQTRPDALQRLAAALRALPPDLQDWTAESIEDMPVDHEIDRAIAEAVARVDGWPSSGLTEIEGY